MESRQTTQPRRPTTIADKSVSHVPVGSLRNIGEIDTTQIQTERPLTQSDAILLLRQVQQTPFEPQPDQMHLSYPESLQLVATKLVALRDQNVHATFFGQQNWQEFAASALARLATQIPAHVIRTKAENSFLEVDFSAYIAYAQAFAMASPTDKVQIPENIGQIFGRTGTSPPTTIGLLFDVSVDEYNTIGEGIEKIGEEGRQVATLGQDLSVQLAGSFQVEETPRAAAGSTWSRSCVPVIATRNDTTTLEPVGENADFDNGVQIVSFGGHSGY